jgi:hypothetical protein
MHKQSAFSDPDRFRCLQEAFTLEPCDCAVVVATKVSDDKFNYAAADVSFKVVPNSLCDIDFQCAAPSIPPFGGIIMQAKSMRSAAAVIDALSLSVPQPRWA